MPKYFSTSISGNIQVPNVVVDKNMPVNTRLSDSASPDPKKKKKQEIDHDDGVGHWGEEGHNSNGAYEGLEFDP